MKKKLISIFIILTLIILSTSNIVFAVVIPRVAIQAPSSGTVEVGGTITYLVKIYNSATSVTLKASDVRVTGVTCNISIEGSGNEYRTIVLSNIQGSVGSVGYISNIAAGVATNEKGGSKEWSGNSTSFTIVATVNNSQNSNTSNNSENTSNNSNNNSTYLPPTNENNNSNSENTTGNEEEEEKEKDETAPTMEIGALSKESINIGDEISFEITYKDETEMGEITLSKDNITLYGFKADIEISGSGNTRKVTLSNVSGNLGGLKYVKIASKTASDKAGNKVEKSGTTAMFKVVDSNTKNKPDDWIENPNTGR